MRAPRLLAVVSAVFVVWLVPAASAQTGDLLPDLGMAPITTVYIDTTTIPGHRLLRYNALLANVGAGAFEVVGSRSSTTDPSMSVVQDIYQSGGGFRSVSTSATMQYQVDARWRLEDLEGGWLQTVGGQRLVALYKHWYCALDDDHYSPNLPDSPPTVGYTGNCGRDQPDLLSMTMGVSVGWADNYEASDFRQFIDITSVPNGAYYLYATADPNGYFTESSTANNTTWDKIRINQNGVKILQYGPHA